MTADPIIRLTVVDEPTMLLNVIPAALSKLRVLIFSTAPLTSKSPVALTNKLVPVAPAAPCSDLVETPPTDWIVRFPDFASVRSPRVMFPVVPLPITLVPETAIPVSISPKETTELPEVATDPCNEMEVCTVAVRPPVNVIPSPSAFPSTSFPVLASTVIPAIDTDDPVIDKS